MRNYQIPGRLGGAKNIFAALYDLAQ